MQNSTQIAFGSFDNRELEVLQTTFDSICKELNIEPGAGESRSRIAKAIITLAKAGQRDPDRLKVYAISRLNARELEGLH
jgi:hypothetical protein